MYVRDELGAFSECAYSLLLSISFLLTHREAVISEQLVAVSLHFIPLLNNIGRVNNAVRLSPLWGRRTALLLGGENDQYWSVVGAVLVAFSSLAGEWEGYLL